MNIRSFSIDRFGILAGQDVPELSPGLNIFLGDNEAGKSTLRDFFRAMFFGYKRDNKNKLDYAAASAAAGLSGGSLALCSSQGMLFNLIRRPGKRGGGLALSEESGRILPENFLAEILSGYTDKMYDQVFCFGYDDLASLSGMKHQDVADVLHAATFGTGFKSPLEVAKILMARQRNLFTPRAVSTPVYKNFKRLAEIRSELARLGSEFGLYNALKAGQEALSGELEGLGHAAGALSLDLARTHSLLAAWDDWSALGETRASLGLNPHPGGEFGVESIAHFDELTAALDTSRAEHTRKVALLESGRASLAKAAEISALAAVWPNAQNLQARRASVQKAVSSISPLETALGEAEDRCSGLVQGLGGGWSLEKILNFELTLPFQEGVERGRQNLDSASRQLEQAENEAQRLKDEARDAREDVLAVRRSFGQSVIDSFEAGLYSAEARVRLEDSGQSLSVALQEENDLRVRISGLEEEGTLLREDLATVNTDLAKAREAAALSSAEARAALKPPLFSLNTARRDTRRVKWLLLFLVLAFLCFLGTYKYFDVTGLGQTSWQKFSDPQAWKLYLSANWLTFSFGLFFLWGAFYWLAPRAATLGRWRPKNISAPVSPEDREALSRADALAGQILAQESQLLRLAATLTKTLELMEGAERKARDAREAWKKQIALYDLHDNCRVEQALKIFDSFLLAAQATRKERTACEAIKSCILRLETAKKSWDQWLETQGFDPGLTPETVRLSIQRIQHVKEQSVTVGSCKTDLDSSREEIKVFQADLKDIFESASFTTNVEGLLARFDALHNAAISAHEEMLRLREQERELEKFKADLASAGDLVQSQEKRLAGILTLGKAEGEADYRLRFKAQAAHKELRREEERLLSRLDQAAGQAHKGGESLWENRDEFLRSLGASGQESLQELGGSLKAQSASTEASIAEKQRLQGEKKSQLKNLESGKGSEALQAEEATLKEELKALVRSWGVMAMARNFISQARRNFEEERHDSVIRQAGEILGGLTAGRYRQMLFDLGGSSGKAYAITRGGESLDSKIALSQGTREQLYLALRLAFIRQHNLTKESLPLIMDDILVNFDPARTRNAAEIFAAFSADNQGLFFTCHPHTAELLRSLSDNSSLFSLKDGCISHLR